ncbi:peroxidase-related enzyme [Roseomonas sp. USHLN139]|uniref:peroxidase-related enzyme n=1 Tax=Roseomonas sp. USHLN139 TaxID=3081298 RepID=UPI003B013B67
MSRFTLEEVGWEPRLPPVETATATPAQLAALEACPPGQRHSIYFRTLVHDPASLGERGALFTKVMYAPKGLPRAERELATAVVSIVNGCVYCTSVHARRFVELSKQEAVMRALLEHGVAVQGLDARQRAIVDYAASLTRDPAATTAGELAPLRAAGLSDLEILDLIHAVAMFANANRLMQALGRSLPPEGEDGGAPA